MYISYWWMQQCTCSLSISCFTSSALRFDKHLFDLYKKVHILITFNTATLMHDIFDHFLGLPAMFRCCEIFLRHNSRNVTPSVLDLSANFDCWLIATPFTHAAVLLYLERTVANWLQSFVEGFACFLSYQYIMLMFCVPYDSISAPFCTCFECLTSRHSFSHLLGRFIDASLWGGR